MAYRWIRIAAVALSIAAGATRAWASDTAPVPDAGVGPARAAQTPAQSAGPDMVTLNFANADIEGVVKVVADITGKNFVIDPRVKGTINIISSQPISKPC